MNNKKILNTFLNFSLVFLSVSAIFLLCIFYYLSYVYKPVSNNKVPYKYLNSNKSIEYLFSNKDNELYYDQNYKGVYLYNPKYNLVTNYLVESLEFNDALELLTPNIDNVIYTETDDNLYYLTKATECEYSSINIKYNSDLNYAVSLVEDINSITGCFKGY